MRVPGVFRLLVGGNELGLCKAFVARGATPRRLRFTCRRPSTSPPPGRGCLCRDPPVLLRREVKNPRCPRPPVKSHRVGSVHRVEVRNSTAMPHPFTCGRCFHQVFCRALAYRATSLTKMCLCQDLACLCSLRIHKPRSLGTCSSIRSQLKDDSRLTAFGQTIYIYGGRDEARCATSVESKHRKSLPSCAGRGKIPSPAKTCLLFFYLLVSRITLEAAEPVHPACFLPVRIHRQTGHERRDLPMRVGCRNVTSASGRRRLCIR